jgi:hypothetical protein
MQRGRHVTDGEECVSARTACRLARSLVRTWPRSSAAAEFVHEAATATLASTWMTQRRPFREGQGVPLRDGSHPPNKGSGLRLRDEYFGKLKSSATCCGEFAGGRLPDCLSREKQGYGCNRDCRFRRFVSKPRPATRIHSPRRARSESRAVRSGPSPACAAI